MDNKQRWQKIRRMFLQREKPLTSLHWRFLLPEQNKSILIHRYVLLHQYQEMPVTLRLIALLYVQLRWWLWYAGKAVWLVYKNLSEQCLENFDVAKSRQLQDLIILAYCYSIPPNEYYKMRLHQWRRENWLDFVYDFQIESWNSALSYSNSRERIELINNKWEFEQFLVENKFSSIQSLSFVKAGEEASESDIKTWPDEVFCKPSVGNQMSGCVLVKKLENSAEGEFKFTHLKGFAEYRYKYKDDLVKLLSSRDYLVQPILKNHEDYIDLFSTDRLSTIRLISARSNTGMIAIHAIMQSHKQKKPAQFSTIAIDVDSGMFLEPAPHITAKNEELKQLADKLQGTPCPGWNNIKSLCLAAHNKLPDMLTIGWDMAYSTEGAVIVEGNTGWGLAEYQILMQMPLLNTQLNDIYIDFINS